MKVCVLASGSKGNCTYLETKNLNILIDIGTTCSYVEEKLKSLNVERIDYIFLTHTHIDHVAGLKVFIKKYNPKVFLTKKMYNELEMKIENFEFLTNDFNLGNLKIEIIKTSHDVSDSNGYIFIEEDESLVYITDTGYINIKNHDRLKNKSMYIMESNHDVELLMNSNRPHYLKQRILGDIGHLSNKDCCNYLKKFVGDKTHHIILIHLSEDNNTEQLAYTLLYNTLSNINRSNINITLSKQRERTELIQI